MSRPDASAIVDGSRTLTYADVALSAGQMAAALVECGVDRGDRVGAHLNKCAEGFVAMHAIVSIGAIAVPLDPGSPPLRLAQICDRMQIDVLISHKPRSRTVAAIHEIRPLAAVLGSSTPASDLRAIDVDEVGSFDPRPPVAVDAGSASYIITTSGSTGEPKGIVHTHRSAVAYANMTLRTYGLCANDRVTDIAPHHFDISTHSLWSVPLAGATNIVINEAYQRLPASHSQLLQDEAVTYWYSVPFLLQQLVLRGDLDNRDLSAMRWVHFGGEMIAPSVIAEMMAHCPNARFGNIFGPAEINQCSLAVFDTPPDQEEMLSVGKPLDHCDIRIIDPAADRPDLENVMTTGEMWAASPQLMEGYWQQPEVNARVIVEVDGKRFYRTGDLVSVDESGAMTFHGRVDHQVKVRGFRIELEGVELALEKLAFADHVVVAVDRRTSGEDVLVAGLLGAQRDLDHAAFLRSAASVLPGYAIPDQLVFLDEVTFTGSGKLDRRVLRERVLEKVGVDEQQIESFKKAAS
jgi:amino acid adenylation domain-containing protein